LVTGAAGFIGSHLSEKLLELGYRVVGVDNLDPYYDVKQKKCNLDLLKKNPNFVFCRQDIREPDGLAGLFQEYKPEFVAHLAAKAGVRASVENPRAYAEINVIGTINLLELAVKHKVANFVFASSSSVYGYRSKVPFREEEPVDKPISPYAATKRSAELLCYVYHHLYSLNVTCLRFFTVYGPRGRPDMAPYKFVKLILEGKSITRFGDGTTKRDYTYITDIIAGLVAAIEKPLGYEIINLGNSAPVSLNEFITTIERLTGKKAKIVERPIPKGDVLVTYADIAKAKKLLGYQPRTKLEQGMKLFLEWFKQYHQI